MYLQTPLKVFSIDFNKREVLGTGATYYQILHFATEASIWITNLVTLGTIRESAHTDD